MANLQRREATGEAQRPTQACSGARRPMEVPTAINVRWSLDFVSDAFTGGRRFRILAVVDDFTLENLALIADTSLPGSRVVREL